MVQYFRAFVVLSILSPLISLPALVAGQQLVWDEDPKNTKCLDTDAGCAKYLNVKSVCWETAKNGKFVDSPEQKDLLKCVCPDPRYLPGLKVCDKCTGANAYEGEEAKCNAFMGGQSPPTNSVDSGALATSSGNGTLPSQSATSSSAPSPSTTPSSASTLSISMMENLPVILAASIFGVAATLVGIM